MSGLIHRIREMRFQQTIDGLPVATAFEDVIDPSTSRPFQRSPVASAVEIDLAVVSARAAQPAKNALGWDERERCVNRLADAIETEQDWLAAVQRMEQGMPLADSTGEVRYSALRFRTVGAVRVPDRTLVDGATKGVIERW